MMETTKIFEINVVGEDSGNPYVGKFTVKTLLTRLDHARADEYRRTLIGSNATAVANRVATEAFICGQLEIRVLDAPVWFKDAGWGLGLGGMNLPDGNVLEEIFGQAMAAEAERKSKLTKKADEALPTLKKKQEKNQ